MGNIHRGTTTDRTTIDVLSPDHYALPLPKMSKDMEVAVVYELVHRNPLPLLVVLRVNHPLLSGMRRERIGLKRFFRLTGTFVAVNVSRLDFAAATPGRYDFTPSLKFHPEIRRINVGRDTLRVYIFILWFGYVQSKIVLLNLHIPALFGFPVCPCFCLPVRFHRFRAYQGRI